MHTFSAAYFFSSTYFRCILCVCTFFHTPARRHKMYTQGSPRLLLPAKSVHTTRTPAPPAGWLYQPPGSAFRAIKCIHSAGPFPDIKCISLPSSFLPSFLPFFSYFLKSAYTSRTPGTEPQPAKSVHTRPPRFVCKKYAYKAAPASLLIVKKCIH